MNSHRKNKSPEPNLNRDPISFFQVERYLNQEMIDSEKQEFMQFVEKNPLLGNYLESVSKQKSPISFENIQKAIEDKKNGKKLNITGFFGLFSLIQIRSVAGITSVFALLLILFIGLSQIFHHQPSQQTAYLSKGKLNIELYINQGKLISGEKSVAKEGDTLKILYQSNHMLNLQLWYSDDGGPLLPYIADFEKSVKLPPATTLTQHKSQIILNNDWREEKLFLVYSQESFSSKAAKIAITQQRPTSSLKVIRFQIKRMPSH